MSYLIPSECVTKMVGTGESKIFIPHPDTLPGAYLAAATVPKPPNAKPAHNLAYIAKSVGIDACKTVAGRKP